MEREEACSSAYQTRTAKGLGWNDNWSTRANQEFERKLPLPISRSAREQETGRQQGVRDRRERVLEESLNDMYRFKCDKLKCSNRYGQALYLIATRC